MKIIRYSEKLFRRLKTLRVSFSSRSEAQFADLSATLAAVHLVETSDRSATCYSDGSTEANYWFGFSAARRTMSPHLSPEENEKLYGISTFLHGHNYRARLTFRGDATPVANYELIESCIGGLASGIGS